MGPRTADHASKADDNHGYAQYFPFSGLRPVNHVSSGSEQSKEEPEQHVPERHGFGCHDLNATLPQVGDKVIIADLSKDYVWSSAELVGVLRAKVQ
jgi:hypothetical protein